MSNILNPIQPDRIKEGVEVIYWVSTRPTDTAIKLRLTGLGRDTEFGKQAETNMGWFWSVNLYELASFRQRFQLLATSES